ncbi:hypothetical protein BVX99_02580 [bacterium F16]|nr:hypothetical protein BVX99_02580 [bacterium F16]
MKKLALIIACLCLIVLCAVVTMLVIKQQRNYKTIITSEKPVIEVGTLLEGPVFYKPSSSLDTELKFIYFGDKGRVDVVHMVKNTGAQKMQFRYSVEVQSLGKTIASGKADPNLYEGLLTVEPGMFVNAGIISLPLSLEQVGQELTIKVQFSDVAVD